ncbi:hypothetical protein TPL01_13110 [Sulfuriferula plumbiphila]|uniref:DUF302 domain-containing protein n=2 Tax=Sulfuriferula plumbiphila TaxID=171865 RepID=A0A512L6R5_9PROT|nr:hypothetical protein SFPGR_23220 [Sulfuriferula plumbiphila]GEP30173.1 hypothetical protein TPL01_13110 [Sulfuriferula plumbiphila]
MILPTVLMAFSLGSHAAGEDAYNVVYTAHGDFEFIRDAVAAAVEGQGLKINHFNKISAMLDNTAAAVGDTRKIYLDAEQMEFCSATISRQMMEADPHSVAMCPYIISVYNLPADPKTIYISYRKPPLGSTPKSRAAFRAEEKLLDAIIKEGIQ